MTGVSLRKYEPDWNCDGIGPRGSDRSNVGVGAPFDNSVCVAVAVAFTEDAAVALMTSLTRGDMGSSGDEGKGEGILSSSLCWGYRMEE